MVIVFDMDDTLYPESSFVLSALNDVGTYAETKWNFANFNSTLKNLFLAGEKKELFQKTAQQLKIKNLTAEQINDLLNRYRHHQPITLPWYPDALTVVAKLSNHYPLGLISDGYMPVQSNKARALGVERWIKDVIFTEELGRKHWKPALTAFNLIMQRYPYEKYVYIADNPTKDFIAPSQLGWSTIQIVRPDGQYNYNVNNSIVPANYKVTDLNEVYSLIK
jgi:putative hydrolase of the HAD superfamily